MIDAIKTPIQSTDWRNDLKTDDNQKALNTITKPLFVAKKQTFLDDEPENKKDEDKMNIAKITQWAMYGGASVIIAVIFAFIIGALLPKESAKTLIPVKAEAKALPQPVYENSGQALSHLGEVCFPSPTVDCGGAVIITSDKFKEERNASKKTLPQEFEQATNIEQPKDKNDLKHNTLPKMGGQ